MVMIITISGNPGSGKNTVGEMLAKELKYEYIVMGDIRRQIAEDRGISLADLNKSDEESGETDKIVDDKLVQIGKEQDNIVVVGRVGFHFIPDSFKIFLDVDVEEGAKRISIQAREHEKYKDVEYGVEKINERIKSDDFRYKKLYSIDYLDKENYDLWVDTTPISAKEVFDTVLEKVKEKI
jgi:cytidylate kinase|tara:strand:- start:220 stop:762 length:543 start_codon:yes stop_codon:yes gene_type:complete